MDAVMPGMKLDPMIDIAVSIDASWQYVRQNA
jgi:hypothetical protein